jgi:hypothetical protein
VWNKTIGVEVRSEPPTPGAGLFDAKIVSRPIVIPDERLRRCIEAALSRQGRALPRDVIAYHLVAKKWKKRKPSTIRHLIEVARADFAK